MARTKHTLTTFAIAAGMAGGGAAIAAGDTGIGAIERDQNTTSATYGSGQYGDSALGAGANDTRAMGAGPADNSGTLGANDADKDRGALQGSSDPGAGQEWDDGGLNAGSDPRADRT